jgi:hypothetical protein
MQESARVAEALAMETWIPAKRDAESVTLLRTAAVKAISGTIE